MRRRSGKAKTAEDVEFTGVNEHFEVVFNAVSPISRLFRHSAGARVRVGIPGREGFGCQAACKD